jgi:hypothetical protein
MVEEVRLLKIEVSPLQLAEWLIHGIAVIISLLQVDSVNDRTRWSDTMGIPRIGTDRKQTRAGRNIFLGGFVGSDAPLMPRRSEQTI